MWGWMVRGAADPVRARELVAAHPESQRLVRDLYLEDLARRGRVKQLTAAAQTLGGADARRAAARDLGPAARGARARGDGARSTRRSWCARARSRATARAAPDLTERILAEDLPPSEITGDDALAPFPGPHEQWLIEHAPGARPALAALAGGTPTR